jgi:carboxypeptidase C (cathepsin A)
MSSEAQPALPTRERISITQHAVSINGVRIPYAAHIGTLTLSRESGAVNTESTAELFFIV